MDQEKLSEIFQKIAELKTLFTEVGGLDDAILALNNINANYLSDLSDLNNLNNSNNLNNL